MAWLTDVSAPKFTLINLNPEYLAAVRTMTFDWVESNQIK